jgi:hypothetical protein
MRFYCDNAYWKNQFFIATKSSNGENIQFYLFQKHNKIIFFQAVTDWLNIVDGKSRRTIKSDPLDFCAYMSGKGNLNPFYKGLVKSLKAAYPVIFHKCPYAGLISFTNLTMERSILTFMPTGARKVKFNITDGENFLYGLKMDFTFL